MKRLASVIIFAGGLAFACPKASVVEHALEKYISSVKVLNVEKSSPVPGFCEVKISYKRGRLVKISTVFVSEDGRYLSPFVGLVKIEKNSPEGFEKIEVQSLRYPDRKYTFGYFFEKNGKTYYVPMLLELNGGGKGKKAQPSQ